MLYRSLERVGATQLRIYDNETDSPVHYDGHTDEE